MTTLEGPHEPPLRDSAGISPDFAEHRASDPCGGGRSNGSTVCLSSRHPWTSSPITPTTVSTISAIESGQTTILVRRLLELASVTGIEFSATWEDDVDAPRD